MMFKIKGGDFSKNIGMIQGVTEKRSTMPILSHVLISSSGQGIRFTATDLENTVTAFCRAQTEGEFSMAVPAGMISDLARETREEEEVSVSAADNDWLEVATESGSFRIAGLPAEDFPTVPEVSPEELFQIPAEVLEDMISKTIFSVSEDEMRRSLSGVFFENRQDKGAALRLVATDGHRLSFVDQPVADLRLPQNVLVPQKAVMEIRRLLRSSGGEVSMGCSGNFFVFRLDGGNLVFTSRVIDQEFPDYMQVVPASTKNSVTVNSSRFLGALSRVSLFSAVDSKNNKDKYVQVGFSDGNMVLGASLNTGEGKESIPVDFSGDGVSLGFNFAYFQDVLKVVGTPEVMLGFSGEKNPMCVIPVEDGKRQDGYVNVIMPIEIDARTAGY